MSMLDQLRKMPTVVADTGEINQIRRWQPQDATTNPSLLKKAAGDSDYADLVKDAMRFGEEQAGDRRARLEATIDKLFVNFGREILEIIPGRVSTEVDARLSFDVQHSVEKARRLIGLYEQVGVDRDRVLIKLASTWEGMVAAAQLEREGIHCNMTLMFNLAQAVAAAEVGATLISPFVGRIYDWHKQHQGVDDIPIDDDPGVASVRQIYDYLKHFDQPVQVMGASFRKVEQIIELAGCDLLTISPDLLEELSGLEDKLKRKLDPQQSRQSRIEHMPLGEAEFRWQMCNDPMATEKLAEGIRRFHEDLQDLRQTIRQKVETPVQA